MEQEAVRLEQVMIRAAIVDDDEGCCLNTKKIAEETLVSQKQNYYINAYLSPMDLLVDLENGVYYNIFLIDVEMPLMSGMKLAKEIQKYYSNALIIFVTDYIQYSPGAFEVNAFRYILKKELVEKLPLAFQAMLPKLNEKEKGCYILRHYLDAEILLYREIYYIMKDNKNSVFFHVNGISRERKSLKSILEELPRRQFLEVSRGYVANIAHVRAMKNKEIIMQNGDKIPIGRGNIEKLIEGIAEYWNSEKY
ncbi:MAG: response regulator transcription factor [Clostridiales bacterium]|nr:response regulator transcription factor [Clostridiales bacterium]